jgi:hypothetical protein
MKLPQRDWAAGNCVDHEAEHGSFNTECPPSCLMALGLAI